MFVYCLNTVFTKIAGVRNLWKRYRKVVLVGLVLVCLIAAGLIMLHRTYRSEEDRYAARGVEDVSPDFPERKPLQGDTSVLKERPSTQRIPASDQSMCRDRDLNKSRNGFEGSPGGKSVYEISPGMSGENSEGLQEEVMPGDMEGLLEVEEAALAKDEWVAAKLEQFKDRINAGDVEDFKNIIGKLDMDYAIALFDNSDGEAIEDELKAYLRETLTPGEYERARELFFEYNYILFE